MLRIVMYLSMALSLQTMAQLSDSFSDGNLSRNPTWVGDTALYKVNSGILHLSAPPVSGKAWISTFSKAIYGSQWEFSVQLDFNPSSSNYAKIFLGADRADLSAALNGYYVLIGNTTDEVSLYRQTGTSATKIIDGRNGILDLSLIRMNIRITTDENSQWTLFTKLENDENWTQEGTVRDDAYKQIVSFGIMCVYTSTRADKFHFDDIQVKGTSWPDREPPRLIGSEIRSEEEVLLKFNESINSNGNNHISITEPGYLISGIRFNGESISVGIQTLKENIPVHLNIKGLSDASGNQILDTTLLILYRKPYSPVNHDIVFNEIMADPFPSVGLSELEYVEILNRSDRYIDLSNWKIADERTSISLPDFLLAPKKYAVLFPEVNSFVTSEGVIVPGLPSLNNSADKLYLLSDTGVLIDSLNYKISWHAVEGKQEGGWSLERIDPESHCDPEKNWTSSIHPNGGTPGEANSVLASRPDLFPPRVLDAEAVNDSSVLFTFNEPLEAGADSSVKIEIQPNPGMISGITQPDRNQIFVLFDNKLEQKVRFKAWLSEVSDCPGNRMDRESGITNFFLPEKPDSLDVIINEVLFNPVPGGLDFVEIFNRSDKFFRLRNWSFTNDLFEENQELYHVPPVALSPGEYLVFADNADVLKSFYPDIPDSVVIESKLPSMSDDEGQIVLLDENQNVLDSFIYSSKFHLEMIRNEEGISLERIDTEAPTQSEQNWRSASFGMPTPGRKNSVFSESVNGPAGVSVNPEIFSLKSPNAFTRIQLDFTKSDCFTTIAVFDLEGRMIRELADNQNLGSSGFFRWDGDRSDGRPVDPGFYVVVADVYNDAGYWRRYRSRVVVLK